MYFGDKLERSDILANLSRSLRIARAERNIDMKDVAKVCGVTIQSVSNWENGKNTPSLTKLCALSNFYGVSVGQLLGKTEVTMGEVDASSPQGAESDV